MKNTIEFTSDKFRFRETIAESFTILSKVKAENDREKFNRLMEEILPAVKSYFVRRLKTAVKNGHLPEGKYKAEDFEDAFYILAYDRFGEVKDKTKLPAWVFKLADEILEDTFVDEEFDTFFFENIDNYTHAEWDSMEEHFSTDGDGDLVPDEESDEPVFADYDYTLKDVFTEDNEADFIDKLSKKVSEERINRHLNLILRKLPYPMRSVFDLSEKHLFSPEEIAEIKKISLEEAKQNLTKVKTRIRISFEKRFNI